MTCLVFAALAIVPPASASAEGTQYEDTWSPGDPVTLEDRINLRDEMTLVRLGFATHQFPENGESMSTGDVGIRISLSDDVDYVFPVVASWRFLHGTYWSVALDAGLVGLGGQPSLGFISHNAVMMPAQYRLNDTLAVTVQPHVELISGWAAGLHSLVARGDVYLGWTNGDRLQGSVGVSARWRQKRIVFDILTGYRTPYDDEESATRVRIGSVGGLHAFNARPLFQARVYEGLHLYFAPAFTFNLELPETVSLFEHRYAGGFQWYF